MKEFHARAADEQDRGKMKRTALLLLLCAFLCIYLPIKFAAAVEEPEIAGELIQSDGSVFDDDSLTLNYAGGVGDGASDRTGDTAN